MRGRSIVTTTLAAMSLTLIITVAPDAGAADRRPDRVDRRDRHRDPTVVVHWNEAALDEIRHAVPRVIGPPMAARALAITHTCMYDAWAAYDDTAVGTRLGDALRRPSRERSRANKAVAISIAAHQCLGNLFAHPNVFPGVPNVAASVAAVQARLDDALATALATYAPRSSEDDFAAAVRVGRTAAQAVIAFRARDGANQDADEPGTPPTVSTAYTDYTAYQAVNPPMAYCQPTMTLEQCYGARPLVIVDPFVWQPLIGPTGSLQSFIGCHFDRVIPFALRSADQYDHLRRADVPDVQKDPERYRENVEEVLRFSASLDDARKLIVEYWADGPASELPPGHWGLFAQFVSQRDRNTLDEDVKMFFAMHNASFDAGIVAWHFKRLYDGVRPITAVRYLMQGQLVRAWGGPGQGITDILGETWSPYNPGSNLTPAFPGYISGHSTFSAASAEVLRLFTGSDRFDFSTIVPKGFGRAEDPATHPIPPVDTRVSYATFTEAAETAALSRILGGIHFMDDNTTGLFLGKRIGRQAWEKAQTYFNGTAVERTREHR
jgi:hypothetical protein